MKESTTNKNPTSSEDTQERCIWMTAGVISFKLCPTNYDCEYCDFDKVMRHQFKNKDLSLNKPRVNRYPGGSWSKAEESLF
jgi:hypothetical protein